MRPDDNGETMCVITGVGGSFAGEAEFASLERQLGKLDIPRAILSAKDLRRGDVLPRRVKLF